MMRAFAIGSSLLLSACYSLQGPPQVINSRGVVFTGKEIAEGERPIALTERASLQARFLEKAKAALDRPEHVPGYAQSGFLLVYANCNDFFWSMGRQQTKANIARDAIAPVGALLAGVIALHSFEKNPGKKEDWLAILGLGSAAAVAGLDIYASNFLFGAENIDSVRILTLDALTVHAAEATRRPATTFEQATHDIIDNQAICTPPHILALTKEAIAAAKLEPRVSAGEAPPNAQDAKVLEEIGDALDLQAGSVTPDQAGALWAVSQGPQTAQVYAQLYPKLEALGEANPLEKAGDVYRLKSGWSLGDELRQAFAGMSGTTIAAFEDVLRSYRRDLQAVAANWLPTATLGNFTVPTTGSQFRSIRVGVADDE